MTEDQRERAFAAGRAIVHGQGDGTYDEATHAIHLLLAALGGSQPAPEKGVRSSAWPAEMPEAMANTAADYYCSEFGWDHDQASAIFAEAYRSAALAQPEAARVGDAPQSVSGIPASMKAWAGGDEPPADWDRSGPMKRRSGAEALGLNWRHHKPGHPGYDHDIVAYTPLAAGVGDTAQSASGDVQAAVARVAMVERDRNMAAPYGAVTYSEMSEAFRADLRLLLVALATPAPRNANETGQDEALRSAVEFALETWSAAIREGLYERIDEHTDDDGPLSASGIFARRLNHIPSRLRAALATQPKMEG